MSASATGQSPPPENDGTLTDKQERVRQVLWHYLKDPPRVEVTVGPGELKVAARFPTTSVGVHFENVANGPEEITVAANLDPAIVEVNFEQLVALAGLNSTEEAIHIWESIKQQVGSTPLVVESKREATPTTEVHAVVDQDAGPQLDTETTSRVLEAEATEDTLVPSTIVDTERGDIDVPEHGAGTGDRDSGQAMHASSARSSPGFEDQKSASQHQGDVEEQTGKDKKRKRRAGDPGVDGASEGKKQKKKKKGKSPKQSPKKGLKRSAC